MRTSVELPKGQMLPSKDYRFGMGKNLQPQPPTSRAGGRMQCAVCVFPAPPPASPLMQHSVTTRLGGPWGHVALPHRRAGLGGSGLGLCKVNPTQLRRDNVALRASQVAPVVKNPLPVQETQETQVRSLGWEDPLERHMATHSSILTWRIPMDIGAWQATVHRVTKSRTQLKRFSARAHTQCDI